MNDGATDIPRVMIAALRGGSGKTVVSIGLIAALSQQGKVVGPFKKGPDYIDAGWLQMAAGRPCYNLDHFLADPAEVCRSFVSHSVSGKVDLSVIEGNRGLYDGLDVEGSTSSASLAKLLQTPVILCLDCTKATRTMAAVVLGCQHFDAEVSIQGIILNRVAGSRHERILRTSIEQHCGIKVLGAIPKLDQEDFPERHMGLIPTPEHALVGHAIQTAVKIIIRHVDLDTIVRIAEKAAAIPLTCPSEPAENQIPAATPSRRPKIGVMRDSAFQFYYPDNLEALKSEGVELVWISPLAEARMPDVDALYIGGGFPETHALRLSENLAFRNSLKALVDKGLPVYAECGGLMYLGESLVLDIAYPMTGILPIVFGFSKKPQGHGYTRVTVDMENPYFPVGMQLRGHEFHYSKVLEWKGSPKDMVFSMQKGRGVINHRDGICYKNVLATYTHVHHVGTPQWAKAVVGASQGMMTAGTGI